MLRGVNVVGRNKIKMDELRALYLSLKFEDARTFIQSGNVIFRTRARNSPALIKKIRDAIELKFGFRPEVILRTADELRAAIAASPFAGRDLHPSKVLLTFLATAPGPDVHAGLPALKKYPEEVHLVSHHLYIYFPNGVGQADLPWSQVEKLMKTPGTARNWNSVTKMLAIAEEMEGAR